MILMATLRRVACCTASYTTPWPPRWISRRMRYPGNESGLGGRVIPLGESTSSPVKTPLPPEVGASGLGDGRISTSPDARVSSLDSG